jgi:type IV pilus assembly protein PilX
MIGLLVLKRKPTRTRSHRRACVRRQQSGMSLIITMLMLIAVMLLGISAAQIALSSEKASRNDRDRQVAFQAAEAALIDAELDIQNSPAVGTSRSAIFSRNSTLGFPEGDSPCGAGLTSTSLGLCGRKSDGSTPAWLSVDFSIVEPNITQSVPYGTFTGQTFTVGNGTASSEVPRYVIELMTYTAPGERADAVSYFYRLTAMGYGIRKTTQVVLQTFYRKET